MRLFLVVGYAAAPLFFLGILRRAPVPTPGTLHTALALIVSATWTAWFTLTLVIADAGWVQDVELSLHSFTVGLFLLIGWSRYRSMGL